MSPTKKVKPMATKVEKTSDNEPKLHQVTKWRKKTLGETRLSHWRYFWPWL